MGNIIDGFCVLSRQFVLCIYFPGGVHRDGEITLDISADLNELGRSSTLVVCSGVKSILDIGRTLEYLVITFIFCYIKISKAKGNIWLY